MARKSTKWDNEQIESSIQSNKSSAFCSNCAGRQVRNNNNFTLCIYAYKYNLVSTQG